MMGLGNGRETSLMVQWDVIYVLPEEPSQSGHALPCKSNCSIRSVVLNWGQFCPPKILVASGDLFGWHLVSRG